jgi:hypothetical protein
VYIKQLHGFEVHGREFHVCILKKALYGLKQAPRAWYSRIDGYLMSLDFTKSDAYSKFYYKVVDGDPLILVLYVDDLFLTGVEGLIVRCKRELASEFEMKDICLMHDFLGLEVSQRLSDIFLRQGKYCKSMTTPMMNFFKKLSDSTSDSDLVDPTMYRQLIGSLMYLVNIGKYIFFEVSTLSEFMVELRHFHWVATKHVLRYLHGTIGYGLRYVSGGEVWL